MNMGRFPTVEIDTQIRPTRSSTQTKPKVNVTRVNELTTKILDLVQAIGTHNNSGYKARGYKTQADTKQALTTSVLELSDIAKKVKK